ncbi:class I SAM-dependent methyltransferase [Actinomycetospora sp. NBRC 106378]|uniref:class I SAM-dependent methyltransferase n=1 Tax=Actinomycetospora sp. NBRC 106378 TaxID=3032208 RepID=UPI0024A2187B|nr:class I SAM-dependent methyltransferase [Actinomycetospora sp. NBRC 106378]GLZ54864.1 putative S-adenosyl-L-methionine-dependent methyltransferase [Actinomycetospora sp. NBRC 106378]
MTDSRFEQWDVVSSVGLTALVVAAGRAVDTHREDGLISDPYAEAFVHAANPPQPLMTRPVEPKDDSDDELWQMMSGYMGTRTRFFDEFFAGATGRGLRQVVVLASGLDTRAHRLDWPAGTTFYEVDQAKMIEFKDAVLDQEGATPRCDRRTVLADLRDDWPAALRAAGFDPATPTAWLTEGLLPYLPAEAQSALVDAIDDLSAPGSEWAIEDFTNITQQFDDPAFRRVATKMGVDMQQLLYSDERPDPAATLRARGWTTESHVAAEVAKSYGRTLDPLTQRLNGQSSLAVATKG